ncbi:patatin-like phospholipase family protein [Mesorhizobium caraganae]|uniref:patatin-like phospholipase family protein n=1 Tax=Mesorhizobium caraganae TaxID=483206 RepID=UPI003ECF4094
MPKATYAFARLRLWRWRVRRALQPIPIALLSMWPVTITAILLLACFLFPGTASDQVVEAILGYVRHSEAVDIQWTKYAITLLSAAALSAILRRQSAVLISRSTVPLSYRVWISGIVGSLPLILLAVLLVCLRDELAPASYGLLALLSVLIIAYLLSARRAALDSRLSAHSSTTRRGHRLPTVLLAYLLPILLLSAFAASTRDETFGLPISMISISQALGPLNILLLACCFWTIFTSWLVRFARRTRLPAVGFLVVLAVGLIALNVNDNHQIRRIDHFTPSIELENAFGSWLASRPDRADFDTYPVILVAAEGGGIRAAVFTATVLSRLVDSCPRLAQHVFVVSGVSGGSIGAAIYAAAMKAKPPETEASRCDLEDVSSSTYQDAAMEVLADDHLSPLLSRYFFTEIFQQFWPVPVPAFDRQLGLEWSLERSFARVFGEDVLSNPLYGLVPTEEAASVPYLILNSTRVRDGRRVSMSPIYLRTDAKGGGDDWHAVDYLNGPPLSAAAGTSARFPFISPPGSFTSLDVKQEGEVWVQHPDFKGIKDQYVDGGYFDNSGAPTLMGVYRELDKYREGRGADAPKFSILVVHVGNEPLCDAAQASADEIPCSEPKDSSGYSSVLAEANIALEAVDRVRGARVDNGLSELEDLVLATSEMRVTLDPRGKTEAELIAMAKEAIANQPSFFDRYYSIQMRDRGVTIPLAWLLSQRAIDDLDTQLDPLPSETCARDASTRRNGYAACQIGELLTSFVKLTHAE